MRRALSFAVPPLVRCAGLMLILAAGTPHRAPAGQPGPPSQPIFYIALSFSEKGLSEELIVRFQRDIAQRLRQPGQRRCRITAEARDRFEKRIDDDRQLEALFVEVTRTPAKQKVALWAKCQDHEGKIWQHTCDLATSNCLAYALEDFPIYVSRHDETCHREKPCYNTDASGLIVP